MIATRPQYKMINVSSDRLQILHKKFSQFFNSKGMYPGVTVPRHTQINSTNAFLF